MEKNMKMEKDMKDEIRIFYGGIAKNVSRSSKSSCCSSGSCCSGNSGAADETSYFYSAENIEGLPLEAINASLGCANPILLADLKKGETVLDLGSGGGIDVLISAKYVGNTGKVYGLDMTDEMLELAEQNKRRSGAGNVEFIKGYIEDIPLPDETVDVITSNCVINLSESKEDALHEAFRVLKKGGRLAIADIVMLKQVPDEMRRDVGLWISCISGALSIQDYKRILEEAGFTGIEITPTNSYSKEEIKDMARNQDLLDVYSRLDEDILDGAFGGALVKANKE